MIRGTLAFALALKVALLPSSAIAGDVLGTWRTEATAEGHLEVQISKCGEALEYRRQKTSKNPSGVLISLPIHPALAEALAASPVTFTYFETGLNKARSRKGLGISMRKWCDKAGLPLCSSHGLRKAICRRIAEAGGTPYEIMAVSEHVTLAMAQKYCETFGRRDMADSAFSRLTGTKAEQNLTNHPERFVKNSPNTL